MTAVFTLPLRRLTVTDMALNLEELGMRFTAHFSYPVFRKGQVA